jgi:hypothetical protein
MMLLNLVEVAKSHTGVNLGITFVSILKTFGIQDKVSTLKSSEISDYSPQWHTLQILSITGDNASNNDTMMKYLGDALDEFPSPTNQTQCFTHTVNLIAKSILKPFEQQKMKEIQEFNHAVQGLADTFEEEKFEEEDGEDDKDGDKDRDKDGDKDGDKDRDKDGDEDGDKDRDKDRDEDGDEDEHEFNTSLEPIKAVLLKVCLHFITLIPSWLTC